MDNTTSTIDEQTLNDLHALVGTTGTVAVTSEPVSQNYQETSKNKYPGKTVGDVKVTDKNSPFFDRVFKVIEEDAEHVVALIEVGDSDFFHLFTKAQVTPKDKTAVVSTIK